MGASVMQMVASLMVSGSGIHLLSSQGLCVLADRGGHAVPRRDHEVTQDAFTAQKRT